MILTVFHDDPHVDARVFPDFVIRQAAKEDGGEDRAVFFDFFDQGSEGGLVAFLDFLSPLIGYISVLRQMYVVKLDYYTYKCLRSIVICAYISTVWNKGHIGCLVPALKAAGVDWSAEYLMDPLQMLPAESYWHGADGL